MWTRGRQSDYYAALPDVASGRPTTRSRWKKIAARFILIGTALGVLAVLIALVFPRRPAVQYACTKFTGLHLDRHHYPYFYLSFTTFAWIVNRNYFPVGVDRIQFDVYHWDEKIAETAMESRRFPARTRVVEGIQTNATGLTKTALEHLYEDTQDGLITIELRGRVQVRSFAREWRYDIRSHFVKVNVTDWGSQPTSDGPCPPPEYTGPSALAALPINSSS